MKYSESGNSVSAKSVGGAVGGSSYDAQWLRLQVDILNTKGQQTLKQPQPIKGLFFFITVHICWTWFVTCFWTRIVVNVRKESH